MQDREWKPVTGSGDTDPLHQGKHSSSQEMVTHPLGYKAYSDVLY